MMSPTAMMEMVSCEKAGKDKAIAASVAALAIVGESIPAIYALNPVSGV